MSKLQIRLVAIAMWLVALVLVIPPLALYEEWTPYRDGKRLTAQVIEVKPYGKKKHMVAVQIDGKRDTVYTRQRPGATLDVIVPANHNGPIDAARLDERRPSLWLIAMLAGVPFVIWLGVMLWRAPTRAARRRTARTQPLDAVVDAVRFTRNVSIGLGIFFVACAGFIAIVPWFDREATTGMLVALELLALTSIVLAVFYFRRAIQLGDVRRNDVLDLIERRPRELAWFYVHEVKAQLGQRGYALILNKTNGKRVALNVIAEDIDALLAAIAQHAPHAKQGWTRELEQAYRKNPRGSLDVAPRPDHTVIFVPALCALLASAIASALLIGKTVERVHTTMQTDNVVHQAADALFVQIADALGFAGSIAVSAVAVAACATWFVLAWRRYRAVVRKG
jgi:hypothetical protein